MAEIDDQGGGFNLALFWRDLLDLEEGTMDEFRLKEVMDLLETSHEARMAYFEYFHQSAVFEMEGAKMSEAGYLPVLPDFGSPRRLFQRSLGVAAIITALLAVVATLIVVRVPEPGVLQASVAAETRWFVDDVLQEPGGGEREVQEGAVVRVASGVLELRLASGTKLVMQGPAKVAFPKLTAPVLQEGWLWVDSGESDDGFVIEARDKIIRDIGTRFGVRVPKNGPVEVHLIEGLIEINDPKNGDLRQKLQPSENGVSLVADEALQKIELARDPFPELADLLKAKGNFRTTILSQTPVGYWRFEEEWRRDLKNEIENGGEATRGYAVSPGAEGVGNQARFRGFPEGNRSLYFEGDPIKSTIVGLGGNEGVSVREGAVSFWLRTEAGKKKDQALWLAGASRDGAIEPHRTVLHTYLGESGQVRFQVENGKADLELVSGKVLNDGHWHQIVASWGPEAAELFVDGKLVDREKLTNRMAGEVLSGRFVRFGKPSLDLREEGMASFEGWLDEVAIWNRALTTTEVVLQYESARDLPQE